MVVSYTIFCIGVLYSTQRLWHITTWWQADGPITSLLECQGTNTPLWCKQCTVGMNMPRSLTWIDTCHLHHLLGRAIGWPWVSCQRSSRQLVWMSVVTQISKFATVQLCLAKGYPWIYVSNYGETKWWAADIWIVGYNFVSVNILLDLVWSDHFRLYPALYYIHSEGECCIHTDSIENHSDCVQPIYCIPILTQTNRSYQEQVWAWHHSGRLNWWCNPGAGTVPRRMSPTPARNKHTKEIWGIDRQQA